MTPPDLSAEEWSALCAELGLVPEASMAGVLRVIRDRKKEVSDAKATLARYCPEADPGRLSLKGVVRLLEMDVLSELR